MYGTYTFFMVNGKSFQDIKCENLRTGISSNKKIYLEQCQMKKRTVSNHLGEKVLGLSHC